MGAWGESKKLARMLARVDSTVKRVIAESEKVPDEDSRRTLFIDTVVRRLQAHVRPPAPPVEAPHAADVLVVDSGALDLECRKCGCPMSANDHQFRDCHATDGDLCAWTPHASHDYPLRRGHCGTCDAHIDEADALKPCPEPRRRAT